MPGPKIAATQTVVSQHVADLLQTHLAKQVLSGGGSHFTVGQGLRDAKQQAADEALKEAARKAMEALGLHPADGSTPPPAKPHLDSLVLNSGPVGFDGPPVGGSSNVSLFPDGSYNFSGHFHDSGFPSYDIDFVWVVATSKGTAFVFEHKGRLHGTTESGSRDENWNDAGKNGAIAAAWDDLAAGYAWQWNAAVNADLGQMVDAATKAVGSVSKVVDIVASA